jgi:branched-chain amino acid transport system ATP-binding protein
VADQGTSLLLIEQNLSLVVRVAYRYLAMAKGNVVAQGQVLNSPEGLKDIEQHILV